MRSSGRALLVVLMLAGPGEVRAGTHSIRVTVSPADFERYRAAQEMPLGREGANEREARMRVAFDAGSATIQVDAGPALRLEELSTRGQTSESAKRRSFEVRLSEDTQAPIEVGGLRAEKLFLLSLQADEGYVSTPIGFKVLALSGLAVPRFSYAELFLNGVSQGLYLAIERPVDVARAEHDAVYVARRRYFERLDVKKHESRKTARSEAEFTRALADTFELRKRLEGEDLYEAWSKRMDIDAYMTWLGLNSLLRNGDFTDEVYFHASSPVGPDAPYFRILPWDMDDLFKRHMHLAPLNWLLSGFDGDTLLFGFECGLDRTIHRDGALYRKFEENLQRELTERVTDDAIDRVIDSTRDEIAPYLDLPAVRASARRDVANAGGLDKDSVLRLLESRRQALKALRRSFLARIERDLRGNEGS